MLLPVIDAGIIQNPMFGGGTPRGWAVLFPTYGPMRVVVDASLAPQQHLGSDLLISGLWVLALAVGVAAVFAAISTSHSSRGAPVPSPTR
ncbi:MAG: hypothetical protein WAL84_13790 [Candidatus Dormiibacterota bacterium]